MVGSHFKDTGQESQEIELHSIGDIIKIKFIDNSYLLVFLVFLEILTEKAIVTFFYIQTYGGSSMYCKPVYC
jgi:hypothetical protein